MFDFLSLYVERLMAEARKGFQKNGFLDELIKEVENTSAKKCEEESLLLKSLQLEKELSKLRKIRDDEINSNKEEEEKLKIRLLQVKV